MKRMHLHIAVRDLDESVRFYSILFDARPSLLKEDYAKWQLEDPRVNFAISARGQTPGLDHLGIQAEDEAELKEIYARLQSADRPVLEEGETVCCYARSEKAWIQDPQGLAWETFQSLGESPVYGSDFHSAAPGPCVAPAPSAAACCTPKTGGCC